MPHRSFEIFLSVYRKTLLFFCLLHLNACSSYTNPGDGSHTLQMTGKITYHPTDANHTPQTGIIELHKKNDFLSEDSNISLATSANELYTLQGHQSRYEIKLSNLYQQKIRLKVETDNDYLSCSLEGPQPFKIKHPYAGYVASINNDLEILWGAEAGIQADEVWLQILVHTNDQQTLTVLDTTITKDTGQYIIPKHKLKAGSATLTISRRNYVIPAGATSGSRLEINYQIETHFLIN